MQPNMSHVTIDKKGLLHHYQYHYYVIMAIIIIDDNYPLSSIINMSIIIITIASFIFILL